MNLKPIKSSTEITLNGIKIELVKENSSIRSVTFTDDAGNLAFVRGDYGLTVCVPVPPPTETKYAVVGTLLGVKVEEMFEREYQATIRMQELKSKGGLGVNVKVEKREVPIPE